MYQFLVGLGLTIFFAGYLVVAIYLAWSERAYTSTRTWFFAGLAAMIAAAPILLIVGILGSVGSSMLNVDRPTVPIGLYILAGVLIVLGLAGVVVNLIVARSTTVGGGRLPDVLASQLMMGESVVLAIAGAWLLACTLALAGGLNVPIAEPA